MRHGFYLCSLPPLGGRTVQLAKHKNTRMFCTMAAVWSAKNSVFSATRGEAPEIWIEADKNTSCPNRGFRTNPHATSARAREGPVSRRAWLLTRVASADGGPDGREWTAVPDLDAAPFYPLLITVRTSSLATAALDRENWECQRRGRHTSVASIDQICFNDGGPEFLEMHRPDKLPVTRTPRSMWRQSGAGSGHYFSGHANLSA
jgi:hypothetical protein